MKNGTNNDYNISPTSLSYNFAQQYTSQQFTEIVWIKITAIDLKRAETAVATFVQKQAFSQEFQALKNGQSRVKGDISIRNLDPVLENGVIRVGGRLHKSSMPAECKHPAFFLRNIMLPCWMLKQLCQVFL